MSESETHHVSELVRRHACVSWSHFGFSFKPFFFSFFNFSCGIFFIVTVSVFCVPAYHCHHLYYPMLFHASCVCVGVCVCVCVSPIDESLTAISGQFISALPPTNPIYPYHTKQIFLFLRSVYTFWHRHRHCQSSRCVNCDEQNISRTILPVKWHVDIRRMVNFDEYGDGVRTSNRL